MSPSVRTPAAHWLREQSWDQKQQEQDTAPGGLTWAYVCAFMASDALLWLSRGVLEGDSLGRASTVILGDRGPAGYDTSAHHMTVAAALPNITAVRMNRRADPRFILFVESDQLGRRVWGQALRA